MFRCSAASLELYQSARHIHLSNGKQTIDKTEFKVHYLLRTFERVRTKWVEVTCSTFFPAGSRVVIEVNVRC